MSRMGLHSDGGWGGRAGGGKKGTKDDQDLERGCLGEHALNAKMETRK